MEPESTGYAIRGGKAGYDRLLVLARERWPDTSAFLRRSGLRAGMHCVDVGCGGGAVTLEIARMVAPAGTVVGLDMDPVKLELAREAAKAKELTNVRFERTLVQEWSATSQFEAAYSRFLLQHLTDPRDLLVRMWDSLRPGGLLLVEDVDWHGWSADPPNSGVDFLRDRYEALLERRGADPRIGMKLRRYLLELGIPASEVQVVSPARVDSEGKSLARLTVENLAESLQADHVASEGEIREAISALDALERDPRALTTGPKVFQVLARKGDPPPPA